MDLDLGPEIGRFRTELRDWLAANIPEGLSDLTDWNAVMPGTGGGYDLPGLAEALVHPLHAEWERRLLDARLVCPHWPAEFGGQGLDPVRLAVLNEEFHRAGVPTIWRGMSESLVGPSVIMHGTMEQKAYFLPRIISGEDYYCQGFSEPSHGSDLAAVETQGEVVGAEILVTGQKVWTSRAARANMIFVLCRTDPAAEKHAGLSYVLLPFKEKGITYRPIKQMSGSAEFCEVFFDGAQAPLFNVIGGLGDGWRVAMTTLGHERGGRATVAHLPFEHEFWNLVETARTRGRTGDPLVRQQLAWAYAHIQLMRFNGARTLAQLAEGGQPGPEASTAKLFWSEFHKQLGLIAVSVLGAEAMVRPTGSGYPTTLWQNTFFSSTAGTIYGGTSEIQRNIMSERVLGLPKSPGPRETAGRVSTVTNEEP